MKTYTAPLSEELQTLIGTDSFSVWNSLCERIDRLYDMERTWADGGKKWTHEYKYRRGGKTLCALYAREGEAGFMVILGAAEREKFEALRPEFSCVVCDRYDSAATYHDGKWIMFPVESGAPLEDYIKLLSIKRRPNKKAPA